MARHLAPRWGFNEVVPPPPPFSSPTLPHRISSSPMSLLTPLRLSYFATSPALSTACSILSHYLPPIHLFLPPHNLSSSPMPPYLLDRHSSSPIWLLAHRHPFQFSNISYILFSIQPPALLLWRPPLN